MEHKDGNPFNIQNYLPHRAPMLMTETILELTEEKVISSFTIKTDNIFLENGYFVESGLIENIAQTCSAIVGQNFFQNDKLQTKIIGFITNIKKIDIFALPTAGDTIISKANLISQYENICQMSCETYLENSLLISAEINLFIQEIKS